MKPGDIINFHDGKHRFWKIFGVHLGAEGQESLIEIGPLTEGHACGTDHLTTIVPEPILRKMMILRSSQMRHTVGEKP